jgi:hypothetical protein
VLIIAARLSAEALPATPANVAFAVTKLIVLVVFILLISACLVCLFWAPARVVARLMRAPSGPARPILAMTVAASPIVAAAILVVATPTVLSGLQFGLGIVASGYNRICASSRDTAFNQVSKTCEALGRAYEVQRYKLRPRTGD